MESIWRSRGFVACLLWPVSLLFGAITSIRRLLYRIGLLRSSRASVPVVVVGNISVGGTGKTPLVAWLAQRLADAGLSVGIVSRGYGGVPQQSPLVLKPDTAPKLCGDEPALLQRLTGLPICVCVDRAAAVQHLVERHDVDLVLSDDGLQHYAMQRDAEIAVLDAVRGIGNGWLLPAGPLRERVRRLASVDMVVLQGPAPDLAIKKAGALLPDALLLPGGITGHGQFHLQLNTPRLVGGDARLPFTELNGVTVHAMAGIGHPQRFFDALRTHGLDVIEHPQPDHHDYKPADLQFGDKLPIIVTSKDAVKIAGIATPPHRIYECSTELVADDNLERQFDSLMSLIVKNQQA